MAVPSTFQRLSQSRMVRNSGSLLVGQGGRVLLQGAYFVLIARALGVSGFGAFASVVALVALVAPFGSLGAINLMIKHIVQDGGGIAVQFTTALVVTVTAGLAVTGALVSIAPLVAPASVPIAVVACVALADLLGARVVEVAGGVYVASERMATTAVMLVWFNAARLAGALVLFFGPWDFTLVRWAEVYLVTSLLAMVVAVLVVWRRFGRGHTDLGQYRREWREGVLFSVSLSSQSVYNDIDKAMLGRLSSLDAAGIYTAAYRIVDMAFAPMRALLSAAYPRFFAAGAGGIVPASRFARTLVRPGVGYCLFASVALFLGADLVPVILGDSYEASVGALRGLAILPLLKIGHYLAADTLTGASFQGMRSLIQVAVAVANVALNFWLIPAYAWQGAVVSSIICDGVLAVALWAVVWVKIRRARSEGPISDREDPPDLTLPEASQSVS